MEGVAENVEVVTPVSESPVVETPSEPVATPSTTPPTETPAESPKAPAFEDLDWEGGDLPPAFMTAFPKMAAKLAATLENLRVAADNQKMLEEILSSPDSSRAELEAARKELKEAKEESLKFKSELEAISQKAEDAALAAKEKEISEEYPDIWEAQDEKGEYKALEKFLELHIGKDVDADVAAASVRKTFGLPGLPDPAAPKPGPKNPPASIAASSKPRGGTIPTRGDLPSELSPRDMVNQMLEKMSR